MSTFTFGEAANTTLQTINANWSEGVTGDARTNGSGQLQSFVGSNTFVERTAWFVNGQPDTQESEIVVPAHAAGTTVYVSVQMNGGRYGYTAKHDGTVLELRRNNIYQADNPAVGVDSTASSATVKITYNSATGVVNGYINNVLKVTFTDGTPLTGGSPGFRFYANGGAATAAQIDSWTDNIASGPTITSVSTGTPREGASLTITGTAFGASQGGGGVTINGVAQTVTSWSDTSVAVTVVLGTNKFGAAYNVILTDSSAVPSNTYAGITGLLPANSGLSSVDIGTPNTTAAYRLTASADLASGDQLEYDNKGGEVAVATDGTFTAGPGVSSFSFRVWTSGSGYGQSATQLTTLGGGATDRPIIRPFNKRSGLGF